MNTFFRIAVFLAFGMLIFTLAVNFIEGLGVFPIAGSIGQQNITEANAISKLTGLSGNMDDIFVIATSVGAILGIGLSILTRSIVPVGIYLFGAVFWTSYIRTFSIFSVGGYISGDFLMMFSIGMIFLFIAAVIGMLRGSG